MGNVNLNIKKHMTTTLSKETLLGLYSTMLKIRLFEEKIVELYPEQEMKCPVHLYIGQEAIAAGVCANLKTTDYIVSNHRCHGHAVAKGADMAALMAEFYGKAAGCSKGKGGSMHVVDVERGMLGTSAIVGGGIPMGVGSALASSIKKDQKVTVVFLGDGASEEGVFYESLNFAALRDLPVVFICENNGYATNSPQRARNATCDISGTASAYKIPGKCIDGNDVEAVYAAAKEAIELARRGGGPSLIEAVTYRWKGHVGPEADHLKGCRPEDELTEWMEKCPVKRFDEKLISDGISDKAGLIELGAVIADEIEEAVNFARAAPYPDTKELLTEVYYKGK